MKRTHFIYVFLFLTGIVLSTFSCKEVTDPRFVVTDYSDADNWLVNPGKDVSKNVDVFYLYPTAYSGDEHSCAITDSVMRQGAQSNRTVHASVYEESANLFMPYYRQMSATYVLTLSLEEQDKEMRAIPAVDGLNAFKYYIEQYNNGRPFILGGHSQGSYTLLYVLEYMKTQPELMERFIAAYVIGFTVTEDFLDNNPPFSFAEHATDQRVIISWNTEAPNVSVKNPVVNPGALVINPISWTRAETHASQELSQGSRLAENGVYVKKEHFADARINTERGVIVCSTADPEDYKIPISIFPPGVLHGCDYSFYYYDLQKNVADRIAAYYAE